MFRTLLLSTTLLLTSGLAALPVHAATPASITLGKIAQSQGGGYLDLPISLSSPDQAISAVQVSITLPSNLKFADSQFGTSGFGQEVSAPSQKGNVITFSRARFDSGFTGANTLIGILEFQPLATGSALVSLNSANSQALAYSTSNNALASTSSSITYTVTADDLAYAKKNIKPSNAGPTTDPRTNLDESGMMSGMSASTKSMINWHDPLVWLHYGSLILGCILLVLAAVMYFRKRPVAAV